MGCGGSKEPAAQKSPQHNDVNSDTNSPSRNNNKTNYNNRNANSSPRRAPGGGVGGAGAGGSRGDHPYPQSKYATSSHNGSVSGEFSESNDKGYKRRIRNQLQQATAGTDIEALEKAKEKFMNNRLEDCGDLNKANDRLAYLKMRRDLRDAIRRCHVGVLERTIEDAERSPYSGQLSSQIDAARRKLEHLRELNKYSHDILDMDQSTISEIHSYHRPPACVHDVMAASYMLLGHNESTLRDWSYVQSLAGKVGRDSLIHRVRDFDSQNVEESTAKRVREILNYHELAEVRGASNGAATFHVWASNIVDKIEKDNSEEEERLRREEEEEKRREEAETNPAKGRKR